MSRYNIHLKSNSDISDSASYEIYLISTTIFFTVAYIASVVF